MIEAVLGVVVLVAVVVALRKISMSPQQVDEAPTPMPEQLEELSQKSYLAGDPQGVEAHLSETSLNSFVALSTALGQYQRAIDAVKADAPQVLEPATPLDAIWLIRINACEALVELGRVDEALTLLECSMGEFEQVRFLQTGRVTAHAWALVMSGRSDEALREMEAVVASSMPETYAAEVPLTKAFALLELKRLEEAEAALREARFSLFRPSTLRNLLLHEARFLVLSQRVDEALEKLSEVRSGAWNRQGGSGLLRLGDALNDVGRGDEALSCWQQAVTEDPESASAAMAAQRIQRVSA